MKIWQEIDTIYKHTFFRNLIDGLMTAMHASNTQSSLIGLKSHSLITLQYFQRNVIISKDTMAK